MVQRMASCKDEKNSVYMSLWYQLFTYALRPWPWIFVAYTAIAMFPEIRQWALYPELYPGQDPGIGFPMVISAIAPNGLKGLMLVAFLAAFMSTISTQMNWGASYLVNDVYKRFIKPDADDKTLIVVARLSSVVVLVIGAIATKMMESVSVDEAWRLLAALGAGTGAVFMLRWFWWRISAWSEMTAMVSSFVYFMLFSRMFDMRAEYLMVVVALMTMATWLLVTFLMPSEDHETLTRFYRKIRPAGPGWKKFAEENKDIEQDCSLSTGIWAALSASGIVYFTLPMIQQFFFGSLLNSAICAVLLLVCVYITMQLMKKMGVFDAEEAAQMSLQAS